MKLAAKNCCPQLLNIQFKQRFGRKKQYYCLFPKINKDEKLFALTSKHKSKNENVIRCKFKNDDRRSIERLLDVLILKTDRMTT